MKCIELKNSVSETKDSIVVFKSILDKIEEIISKLEHWKKEISQMKI